MSSPLDGALGEPATFCVTLSLALFALGGADLTGRFYPQTLSISRPTTIMRPILDMVAISRAVEGMVCEESERCVNVYNALYCILQRSCHTRFLRPKPDAHRMYAQDQVVIHTDRM
jgi:hypothetical protein